MNMMNYWTKLLHVKLSKNLKIKATYNDKECLVMRSFLEFKEHFIEPTMRNRSLGRYTYKYV